MGKRVNDNVILAITELTGLEKNILLYAIMNIIE